MFSNDNKSKGACTFFLMHGKNQCTHVFGMQFLKAIYGSLIEINIKNKTVCIPPLIKILKISQVLEYKKFRD